MRIGFVHEWLDVPAGAEKALEAVLERYPGAPVHALVYDAPAFAGSEIAAHPVIRSWLDRLPGARTQFRFFLPLMPMAVEQFDLSGYDVVVSNVKAVAHGAITAPEQLHVAYFNRTMRYAWDTYHAELSAQGVSRGVRGVMARAGYHYLRLWDWQAMQRPDVLVANSDYSRRRIAKHYRRDARVIHPPVDVDAVPFSIDRGDRFVVVARLVPNKNVEAVVRAFASLELPLDVIGSGALEGRLRMLAGPDTRFLGWLPVEQVHRELGRARALVVAGDEDFGIAPVEAQAAGTPVIALARGGVMETVVHGETGVLVSDMAAFTAAVRDVRSGRLRFEPERLRQHAERFGRKRFQEELTDLIEQEWAGYTPERGMQAHRAATAGPPIELPEAEVLDLPDLSSRGAAG